ncbi:hypothetical protein FRC09_001149 [Ceratobasidium sp. 395]|nr:hypothetical protein FRC09_001149 [Ceratobasidium sp. 395]
MSTLVETRINYFVPPADGSRAFRWINSTYPGGGPRRNWEASDFAATVENVRGRERSPEFNLDVTGFEFHKSPTKVEDFGNESLIKSKYYEECIQNLKDITGASRVVIFDHTIRRPRPEGTEDTPDNRGPALIAHVDQTPESAERRVRLHLLESDVPSLLSKRYQIINLWRSINNPAWQLPLALCDFRSVANEQGGDFVPITLKYPDRDGETLGVKHNSQHKWKYLAGMTPDEFILIKCFDSKLDGSVATFTPHTAINDPTTPAGVPDRQSIEIRALVFYDE